MNNWIKQTSVQQWIINICMMILAIMLGISIGMFLSNSSKEVKLIVSEQWGGPVPMKIYTVFDRDTGVYYAVTEKGGICVMETMSGETKLVDEGEPPIIHPNQGESNG